MRLRPGHQLAYLLLVQLRIVATSSEELVVVRPVFDEEEGAHEQSLLEGGSWSRPSCKIWGDPHIEPFIGNYFDIQLATSAAPTIPNGPNDKPFTLISSWTPGKWQTKIQVRAYGLSWGYGPCARTVCRASATAARLSPVSRKSSQHANMRQIPCADATHKPRQYNI